MLFHKCGGCFQAFFGDLQEPEAWRGVAVRVDHDVPGPGDGQVLASLVATWVAIRALEQLVPVLAHHHQVGHPDVAHLSVGLSAVRILVSRSSQEQIVTLWVHRHYPHLVVDVPCIEAPWLPISSPPELLLGCTVHLNGQVVPVGDACSSVSSQEIVAVAVNDQVKDLVGSSVKSIVLAPGNAQVVVHLHHDALLVVHPNRSSNNITAIDRISSYLGSLLHAVTPKGRGGQEVAAEVELPSHRPGVVSVCNEEETSLVVPLVTRRHQRIAVPM